MCLGLKRWRLKVCEGVLHSSSVVYGLGLASLAASRGNFRVCRVLPDLAASCRSKRGSAKSPNPTLPELHTLTPGTALNPKLQSKP